jgi:ABC-2 type transport system permease protein
MATRATDSPIEQPPVWTLLAVKWRSALTRRRQGTTRTPGKLILLGLVGLIFWLGIFFVMHRVLKSFKTAEEIGVLLSGKLLGTTLLAFLSILLLSNLITSLSTFFLAKDLDLVVSAPLDWLRFYLSKLAETVVHSSWMVMLLAIPIFTAYGVVFGGGWLFPIVVIATLVPYLVMPAVIGCVLTLVLVNVFPARRTRDLLSLIAIGAAGGLVLLLRVVRPERLARPEGFQSLVDFITVLKTPTSPILPSEWATNMVMNWLVKVSDPLPIALLWTTAAAFVVFGALLHRRLYATGFTKAQEGAEKFVRGASWQRLGSRLLGGLGASRREFLLKDLRVFFRDATQWSQLILLAVLIVVYLFNITALPLFTGEKVPFFLITLIVFLNLGLAGFVLAAIAGRFIFPSFSLEGKQMWLLRSSPLDLRALLWSKYWIGTTPLLVLALTITALTNIMLQASAFMMGVSLVTIVLLTFSISALALGFGVLYPQFDTENAAQIPTSFGGLVFMMSAVSLLGLVIMAEARPVMSYLKAQQEHTTVNLTGDLVLAGLFVLAICIGATIIPLQLGLKRMEEMEF